MHLFPEIDQGLLYSLLNNCSCCVFNIFFLLKESCKYLKKGKCNWEPNYSTQKGIISELKLKIQSCCWLNSVIFFDTVNAKGCHIFFLFLGTSNFLLTWKKHRILRCFKTFFHWKLYNLRQYLFFNSFGIIIKFWFFYYYNTVCSPMRCKVNYL